MSFGMSIDFATFNRIVSAVVAESKPILIRGRHGIGKSELVYQIARDLGLPVVERRASQMTEGDLVGLPSINGNRTSFNPPDWFKEACERPVALFLDEVDRATVEVRQGIFELTDSRKLNGHVLHPGTRIFAAVNGGKHGQQYQVGEMDPAELDRWSVFDVEPTVEDWLSWAKDNVHGMIWDFINNHRNHLEHTGEFEPNKKYPSRRSWKRCNDVLVRADALREDFNKDSIPLAAAFVGYEAAIELGSFVQNYKRVVTPDQIIVEGKVNLTEKFTLNEHIQLIEKMEANKCFHNLLSPEHMNNVATYLLTLPSEAAMKLWKIIGKPPAPKDNTIVLHKTVINGVKVGDHVTKLLSGEKKK
jgi:alkaline phosphatase D